MFLANQIGQFLNQPYLQNKSSKMLDMTLWVTEPNFPEKYFALQKLGKWTKNGPKKGFLNLLKNLVINIYWICSKLKIYIICCVSTQIPYLGKFLFLRYAPKCSQPIKLQDFLIDHIFRTIIEMAWWFFTCWYKFTKIKSWSKHFRWAWSKMGVASLVTGL